MQFLDLLEKRIGRYSIPNITIYLVAGQAIVFAGAWTQNIAIEPFLLIPERVLNGQLWRIISYVFVPMFNDPISQTFSLYIFYLMGSALEYYWGTFRYNFYLFVAYVATVLVSFITPVFPASNMFIYTSVFLAFSFLNPNFELHLFFLLPIRIKWLALITWLGYLYVAIVGPWTSRFVMGASVCNFLLFFGRDILQRMKSAKWKMSVQAEQFVDSRKPRHACVVCDKNSNTHPNVDFRYCSKCEGQHGYCPDHVFDHEHITKKK